MDSASTFFYKRVVIHEFLNRFDQEHPLIRAYKDGKVCMANSFRSKLVHKKSGFAILTEPTYHHLFEESELELIRKHLPWTRLVRANDQYLSRGGMGSFVIDFQT